MTTIASDGQLVGRCASIPKDAQPANLERYIYQFRLGPTGKVINTLLDVMSPDKAATWAGAKTARASAY